MTDHQDTSPTGAVVRVIGVILAWAGSWKVGEVQQLFGALSALAVGGYAVLQAYVLWRDKIKDD